MLLIHIFLKMHERRKLDSKSRKCVFLGYSESRKGYRLHDAENQKIVHSRDVTFNELTSPFKKES